MEKKFTSLVLAFVATLQIIISPVYGQSRATCTGAMIRSFGPCMNFLTGGSNASSPTPDCCSSLKNLVSNGQDCLCLIVTGVVPLQIPINRTLAISLPRACRMSRVPVECKEKPNGSEPNLSPATSPPSPRAPVIPQPVTPSLAPESDFVPTLTPPGMRPTLVPSAAETAHNVFRSIMAAALGVYFLKFY
ncbi:non-specific lipid transfer protein GPI-anchored 20-like isoform X1 [Henckelia pumila]|uniref:non-specific lipid transfer protein GPI-anchored 20-like isoform X1 n=1 Tax=Henckelia pumila TaxID=405737 RepID=UPI003C6E019B